MNRSHDHRSNLSMRLALFFLIVGSGVQAQSPYPEEDRAIRQVLARFYDGWNTHDVGKMLSVYAEDIDHINVFAEWHKGKESIGQDLQLVHNGMKKGPDGSIRPAG